MKFGESETEKKARLERCMQVLRQVNRPGNFKPLQGIDSDPRTIHFQRGNDSDDDECNMTQAELVVLNKGKKMRSTGQSFA